MCGEIGIEVFDCLLLKSDKTAKWECAGFSEQLFKSEKKNVSRPWNFIF